MLMLRFMCGAVLALLLPTPQEPVQKGADSPAATQPASQPAHPRTTLRKPKDFEVLEPLLVPEPIRPEREANTGRSSGLHGARTAPELLPEGRMIIEKRGRYVLRDGRPLFEFTLADSETGLVLFELQRNQLLEVMETAVENGTTEFTITAEVQRYRNQNLLNMRKLLRHVDNGNLRP
jgi:hypothetical protein